MKAVRRQYKDEVIICLSRRWMFSQEQLFYEPACAHGTFHNYPLIHRNSSKDDRCMSIGVRASCW